LQHALSKSEEPQKFECDKRIPYDVPKAGFPYKNRICGWEATKVYEVNVREDFLNHHMACANHKVLIFK